jgi:threonine dehydrogenase-like Zn-dependent dehydrogenase
MRAITVIPQQAGSARLDEVAEPSSEEGELLVQTLAVGVCGTDLEISQGDYGCRRRVLLEPTSVVAKAWEHIERIAARAVWSPEVVLVTGAGPLGLLAALLGSNAAWRSTSWTG